MKTVRVKQNIISLLYKKIRYLHHHRQIISSEMSSFYIIGGGYRGRGLNKDLGERGEPVSVLYNQNECYQTIKNLYWEMKFLNSFTQDCLHN